MRVYCLTSSYPAHDADAAGTFVREQCDLLRQAGHSVRVFTWRDGERAPDVTRAGWLPGRWSVFSGAGAPDLLERQPWRMAEGPLAVAAMLERVLRCPTPDVWVGHWLMPGGVTARLAAALTRRPCAVVGHSAGVHLAAKMPRVLHRLFVRPGATTVPTRALAEHLVDAAPRVLPMGFWAPGKPPAHQGDAILLFGRLVPIKGWETALEALAGRNAEVIIAGDGPMRGELEARAEALAIGAEFLGHVGAARKAETFARARLAIFGAQVRPNGRHEGWPVSVLEVSSMGVVPVVADWPGAAEMVVEPSLQVVSGTGPGPWRAALDRLEQLPAAEFAALRDRTMAHAARYSWEVLGPRWVRWFEEVAGN